MKVAQHARLIVPDPPRPVATPHGPTCRENQRFPRELPEIIKESAARLFALAQERDGATGRLIVIYHGQVGWESDGPIEVCVPIKDHDRAHRIEPEHWELFTSVRAEDVQFPRILAAFEAVQLRTAQFGLTPAGPPREVYEPDTEGTAPRCEVALPVSAENVLIAH